MSFWFDNWTKQGTLYYIENQEVGEDEMEVKEVIENGEWNEQKIKSLISNEMVDFIVEHINPKIEECAVDVPWWMGNCNWVFTMKFVYENIRSKKEKEWWWNCIWSRGVPFKF